MAEPPDGPASRAPELEDLVELSRSLNAAGVEYLLIGGFAVILHGFVRGTKDIDLLIEPSPENVARVKKALSYLPDNAAEEIEPDEIGRYAVVRVADEIVVDLMSKACGIDYEEAVDSGGCQVVEIGGEPLRLATKELLIRTKDTVRPSDAMDVEFLRLRIEEDQAGG